MYRDRIEKWHHNGRGRTFFGLGISLLAFLWLAKKLDWLGVGSTGIAWPVLLIFIGLAFALGGSTVRQHGLRKEHAEPTHRDTSQ